MEGNGCGGSATPPWGLGMHWAPAGPAYPQQQPFVPPRPGGGPSQQQELTWLKLGKRPCCSGAVGGQVAQQAGARLLQVHGNGSAGGGSGTAAAEGKRKEKAAAAAVTTRCQVEGCHAALVGAKEYHRRHRVCEAHSKAPRVVLLGAEQRFCQQCSRFHAILEFDNAKRSCRRRLAGHNERRRKSNASEAMARGAAHPHGVTSFGHGFLPPCDLPASPAGALSFLSSARGGGAAPWQIPAPDISARSSAALDELIAENRAALLAWQFFAENRTGRLAPSTGRVLVPADMPAGWHAHLQACSGRADDDDGRYHELPTGHTTLDLMQTPATASTAAPPFRPVPERAARPAKKDGDAAGCSSDAWASVEGARVV